MYCKLLHKIANMVLFYLSFLVHERIPLLSIIMILSISAGASSNSILWRPITMVILSLNSSYSQICPNLDFNHKPLEWEMRFKQNESSLYFCGLNWAKLVNFDIPEFDKPLKWVWKKYAKLTIEMCMFPKGLSFEHANDFAQNGRY